MIIALLVRAQWHAGNALKLGGIAINTREDEVPSTGEDTDNKSELAIFLNKTQDLFRQLQSL